MTYTAKDISNVTGMPVGALHTLIHREQIIPAAGRQGRGKGIEFTASDALQTAFVMALRGAKVALDRAPAFWHLVTSQSNPLEVRLYVLQRPDGSDCDFKICLSPERPTDVPKAATLIDVGDLMRQVIANLETVELNRLVGEAPVYPWRQPFVSPVADSPWEVFRAITAGDPDGEIIARITDAVEAQRSILAVGDDQDAFTSLCSAIHRVLVASEKPAATVH